MVRAGPLRSHFQLSTRRGLTKFVGREREMEALKHAAARARSASLRQCDKFENRRSGDGASLPPRPRREVPGGHATNPGKGHALQDPQYHPTKASAAAWWRFTAYLSIRRGSSLGTHRL